MPETLDPLADELVAAVVAGQPHHFVTAGRTVGDESTPEDAGRPGDEHSHEDGAARAGQADAADARRVTLE